MTDSIKSLKHIDLASITIMGASINFIFGIILAIVLLIIFISTSSMSLFLLFLLLAMIFGILIFSIPDFFGRTYLFNFLISRLKGINLEVSDENITNISVFPTALICSIITLIITAMIYPGLLVLGTPLTFVLQLFGYSGILFYLIYLLFNPLIIFYSFIVSFISVAISTYVFNLISPKIGGLNLKLGQERSMTKINSINYLNLALILGVILATLGLIIGIITSIIMNFMATVSLIVYLVLGGFIVGFIGGALIAVFYNFLAPRIGELKVELESKPQKISNGASVEILEDENENSNNSEEISEDEDENLEDDNEI
jgi:hypothetical protein